jgi:hypothetical protein
MRRRPARSVWKPSFDALEWRWCPSTSDLSAVLPDYVAPAHQSLLSEDDAGPDQAAVDSTPTGSDVQGVFSGPSNTGWMPPDDNLAVSSTRVVEAVNEVLAFYNKDGSSAVTNGQSTLALTTLFAASSNPSIFDPRISFDPANGGHFLLVAVERDTSPDAAYLYIATSTDSSPGAAVSSWRTCRVNVLTNVNGSSDWLDFPGMGFDSTALYVTGNLFGFSGGFGGAALYTFDKNALETGTLGGSGTPQQIAPANSQRISDGGSIQPAITLGPASAEYMIEDWDSGLVRVHAVTNPLASGGLTRTTALVSVPAYGLSVPGAPQLGSSNLVPTNDTRILNVVDVNGSLWAAHTFENTSGGQDKATARWYQITPGSWPGSGSPSLVRSGTIDPGPGISTFFPSIAVDAGGDVAVGYAESSATMHPSAYVTTVPVDGSPGTTTLLQSGQTAYTASRWGDYSGTVADPTTPDLFWAVGEATPAGGGWGTWWAPIPVTASHFEISAPTNVTAGVPFTITVTALTPAGNVDTSFTGPVHFTAGDNLAVLPGDYSFTAKDQGIRSFTVTLKTVGTRAITATDPGTPSITGQASAIAVASGPWTSYAHDSQHTDISTVASQPLQYIEWQAPVDLQPQFSGNDILIHYGSPLVTQANTVVVPVKTGASSGFEIQGRDGATGHLKWTLSTDYLLPPSSYWNWVPSYSPVSTQTNQLVFPGAGGTVYVATNPDASGTPATSQIAFYGIANYSHSAFDSTVFIGTPITADTAGDLFFGFLVVGSGPLGLQSGIARIGANGVGTWVAASTAAGGDSTINQVVENCAPALSNDEKTLYITVSNGNGGSGYLVALDSTTLNPLAHVVLKDPQSGDYAALSSDGTASPTVGPDGDVYIGVLDNPFGSNNGRGWLLHFSADLSQTKVPGAFGWDDTASIVPASLVPSYQGTSSYLVMTKYNNYAGLGTGNGNNRLAILDPNAAMTDPISGATVMKEVLTIAGPTPDPDNDATFPNAVQEWCINSAAVDPATKSILANSEDGKLYRWDLTTNTFTQVVTLTPGVGEAYTPTVIGTDGTVYAINDATLFAVGATAPQPAATVSFVAQDTTTQGNWKSAYGGDGFDIAQDTSASNPTIPAYATVALTGTSNFTWTASTSDPRALQKAASGSTDQLAACWYTGSSLSVDVHLTDGAAHQIAVYALDWDSYGGGRSERIDVVDDATGLVLDTRSLSSFQNGVYLVWNITGNATIRVTNLNPGSNAVLSGLFFGGAPSTSPPAASVSFVTENTTAQGNWKSVCGGDGFDIAQDTSASNPTIPAYATVALTGTSNFTWTASTSDPRALQKAASGSTDQLAACWYTGSSLSVDVHLTDGAAHPIALYALDWDGYGGGRSERIDVVDDASGTVLDTRSLSSFQNGVYLAWIITGNVTIRVTNLNPGSNAVLSGLFFGGVNSISPPASVSFVAANTTTQGNWKSAYGGDGFDIAQDTSASNPAIPAYATVALAGNGNYTWTGSTSDTRALQKAASGSTDRLAACWYTGSSLSLDVHLTDGAAHQIAVYALDWDDYGGGRSERIDVVDDATSTVLDTRSLSSFQNGVYLVWNISGNVTIRVTNLNSDSNAVLSGLFFG